MKKLISTAAAISVMGAAVFVSCNRAATGDDTGRGSMRIHAETDPAAICIGTRAANLDAKTYILTIESGGKTVYSGTLPADGTIGDLPVGTCTATLRSAEAEFSVPAFDAPYYSDTKTNIGITPGGSTPVDFLCRQTNAGVRFVHDQSLAAAGLGSVVPVVAQNGVSLTYDGANGGATGYFLPGNATLTLTIDGKPLTVGGEGTVPLTLSARELWTITLRVDAASGGAGITVVVDTATDGKDLVVTLDPPTASPVPPVVPDPSAVVFSEEFARCTGPALPVAGAVFKADAIFGSLGISSSVEEARLTAWSFNNCYTCAGGLKLGNIVGNSGGSATTPALAVPGTETVTVTFLAANFETSPADIVVGVTGGGTVSSPAGGVIALPAGTPGGGTIAESAAMKRYTAVITGATSATRVTFSSAAVNRWFLSAVTVAK